jgi:hypothetical protein
MKWRTWVTIHQVERTAITHEAATVQHELSVLALIRGKERYVYVYDDFSREDLIEAVRAQAADPKSSLSWFDAAVLTERARQQATETASPMSPNG